MKHFVRMFRYVVVVIGLITGAFILYQNMRHVDHALYVVQENGEIAPASSGQFGIEKERANFLTLFRKSIISEPARIDMEHVEYIKVRIKHDLLEDYARDGPRLNEWASFASDRERFIAYLMLRVNGSLPAFYPAKPVSFDLRDNLLSTEGNCSHHSFRLLMVLDIFSIEGRLVSWWSPAIEGHVFVDAFDPLEGKSYFVDPTSNLMAAHVSSGQHLSFLETIEIMSPQDRKVFLSTQMKAFPNFVSRSHALPQDFTVWSVNNYLRAKDSIITGFSFEFPVMQGRWRDKQSPWPQTLCDLANQGYTLIQTFQPTGCQSRSL